MRVIDLGNGQEEYDDEIYDRRGGRGRSRRSDGTYMGYDGGVYDHYGKDRDGMMEELERRERNLERRERELERNERELEKFQSMANLSSSSLSLTKFTKDASLSISSSSPHFPSCSGSIFSKRSHNVL